MDKLVCLLCRNNYREPKMCANCSEIFCGRCIENYVSENHLCPKCDHVLPELADCTRLIQQIKEHVKVSNRRKIKTCKTHKLPLKYQCEDCQRAICADCGIIDEQHRGHIIVPRNEETSSFPKAKLREYLVSVQECILKDHSRHQQLILEREVLKSQIRWCRNKLREFYQEMTGKLQRQAQTMMKDVCSDLHQKERRLQKLKKIKEDVNEILNLGQISDQLLMEKIHPQNQLIEQLSQGEQSLFKLQGLIQQYKDGTYFQFNRNSLYTINHIYPDYVNHTYQFDYEGNKYSQIKYSEPFSIYGQEWRLKIYPGGNGQVPGHMSLFLQLISAPNSPLNANQCLQYFFRLQLISLNQAGQTISKEYRSPYMEGDCWGYNDFVTLGQLPEYLNSGHLIFVVGIKNCSYFDVSEIMKRYIRKLEDQKKVLEELMGSRNVEVSDIELFSGSSEASSRIKQRIFSQ